MSSSAARRGIALRKPARCRPAATPALRFFWPQQVEWSAPWDTGSPLSRPASMPALERQLEAIRPKAICVFGGTAAKYLLKAAQGITKIRGQWHEWQGIPVMPTYHPSFLLRPYAQQKKREAWQDLRAALHYVYD